MTSELQPATDASVAPVGAAVSAATFASMMLIAQHVGSRAMRDGLFLSQFPVERLPRIAIAGAAVSLLSVLIASMAMARWTPARVAPVAFGANAVLFLAEWVVSQVSLRSVAITLYLHVAFSGATVISIFWSLISERFDPHTCKKHIGTIGAGGSVGGVIGGLLAWQASALFSVRSILLAIAVTNLACSFATMRIAKRARVDQPVAEPVEKVATPLGVLRSSRYLQTLGLMVIVVALVQAMLDYVLNARAAEACTTGVGLVRFFAVFHTATAVLTLVIQSALAARILRKLGPAGTLTILPGAVVAIGTVAFQFPSLASTIVLRASETAISNSLYKSGYELFYSPIADATKRKIKPLIDVAADRVGTAIGNGLTIAAIGFGLAGGSRRTLLASAIALSIVAIWLTRRLHRAYVNQLAESMRLLEASGRTAQENTRSLAPASPAATVGRTPLPGVAVAANERLVKDIRSLVSGSDESASGVIAGPEAMDVRLVAYVIPHLASSALRASVTRALSGIAPRITGQLADALLDTRVDEPIRRRIPDVLRGAPGPRAIDALIAGLGDPSFEVRYQCARALLYIVELAPKLAIPSEALLAAAVREIDAGAATWVEQKDPTGERDPELDRLTFVGANRPKISRELDYVFAILAIALDREPILMALRAISTGDQESRGTALEYLENVLPEAVRAGLWATLELHLASQVPGAIEAPVPASVPATSTVIATANPEPPHPV